MNKTTFFLILLVAILALPVVALGQSTGTAPEAVLTRIETTAKAVGTTIVVIGWIIAGILYLTAQGAPDRMGTAKKALIYCVIGTALIALAITGQNAINLIKNAIGV